MKEGVLETAEWQQQLCPPWCSVVHTDHDHPEDRSHRDDGAPIPIVMRKRAIVDDELVDHAVEASLLVGRWQRDGDRHVWWHLGIDGDVELEVSTESLSRVVQTLQGLLAEAQEALQSAE